MSPKLDRKTKFHETRVYIFLDAGSLSIAKTLSSLSMVTSWLLHQQSSWKQRSETYLSLLQLHPVS